MKKSIVLLIHLGYWFLYCCLIFFVCDVLFVGSKNKISDVKEQEMCYFMLEFAVIPALLAFYIFYGVLFRRYLIKRKFRKFAVFAILAAILASQLGLLAMYIFPINNIRIAFTWQAFEGITSVMSVNALLNGIIGVIIRGFLTWFEEIKVKEELSQKNYNMELAMVKSQLSPHFLFNTINNIDVLIQRDATTASAYLNKLSDIMRFMLYETKTDRIPLSKELDYIDKFIDLQKIRTSNEQYINYSIVGDSSGHTIAPMLFIPFIENAFKFSTNKKIDNAVNISFGIDKDTITFTCENNYTNNRTAAGGGLGNELLKRRMVLLYPDLHHLDISDSGGLYKVKLSIQNDR